MLPVVKQRPRHPKHLEGEIPKVVEYRNPPRKTHMEKGGKKDHLKMYIVYPIKNGDISLPSWFTGG